MVPALRNNAWIKGYDIYSRSNGHKTQKKPLVRQTDVDLTSRLWVDVVWQIDAYQPQTSIIYYHNDAIIASCVHWVEAAVVKSTLRTPLLDCKCHIGANNNKIIFKSHLPISSHQNRN